MSYSKERRFLLSVFNFVFNSHSKKLPSNFTETLRGVAKARLAKFSGYSSLSTVMRLGIMNAIETHNVDLRSAPVESVARHLMNLVMNSFNEENLLYFICFQARNCLFEELDADDMVYEFEEVMRVINNAKISGKFTKQSWEKLEAAARVFTKEAEQRRKEEKRERKRRKLIREAARLAASTSSTLPQIQNKPAAKQQRTVLPSTSSSVEMSDAGPTSVKSEEHDP